MIYFSRLVARFMGLMLLLGLRLAWGQSQTIGFTHFGTNQGLSHSNVFSVLQDHQGFMWFGTLDGLDKFDGYRFTVYKKDPANAGSLSNNYVSAIKEDRLGTIWAATRGGGLNRLDRRRNRFVHYQHSDADPRSLSNDFVSDILIDYQGYVWITTEDGLNRFDPRTNQFTRFLTDPARPGSISDNKTNCLLEDSQHRLWVGTEHGGLNRFDPATQTFTNFRQDPALRPNGNNITVLLEDSKRRFWVGTRGAGLSVFDPVTHTFADYKQADDPVGALVNSTILSLAKDQKGHIWIGTENNGVNILNPEIEVCTNYRHDEIDQRSLVGNSVNALYRDATGNMWLGVYGGGVDLIGKDANMFTQFKHTSAPGSLNNNAVLTFFEDSGNNIWVGTDGGGMSLFDRNRRTFIPFTHAKNKPNSLSGDYVLSIAEDSRKRLWIGTWNDGLSVYDKARNQFTTYRHHPPDSTSLSGNNVYSVLMDREKTMWVATWGEGLNRYDPAIDGFRHYRHDPANLNSLASDALHYIIQDRRGYFWIATSDAGLDRFDAKRQQFAHFTHHDGLNSLSNNNVSFLYEDRAGNIWITTATGLNRYNPVTNLFTNYDTKDGLPNDVVTGILEDEAGNFWISSNGGLSMFTPRTGQFQNFTQANGLQASEFKQHACLRARSGLMYFGGINGFNVFRPSLIRTSNFDPPLLFTNLLIFNKEVPVTHGAQDPSPLKQPISETSSLKLPYGSSVVTFEFASLNYTLASKKNYAYRLMGFDKDWNFVGTAHTATYTNLDPGRYTFEVKGLTNKGEWSGRVLSLILTVETPYWLTWWFKLLVLTAILGSVYWFYRLRINAIKAQKWVVEQILVDRTERLHQEQTLNKMKSQFISTASHEFRTPLATIQSSVDLVSMYVGSPALNAKPDIQKHLTIIEKQIDKFGDLLDDVLSIERMNAGKIAFVPRLTDITLIYTDVIMSHFQARKDQRTVDVSVTGTPRPVLLDEKLISHALTNLLSNAFKYSATNPRLYVDFGKNQLTLSVTDQGIGIPPADLLHLFETFYRAGNVSAIQGTGLGLFIARQSVELHGGTITVHSQEHVGTTFTVILPAHPTLADPHLVNNHS